MTREMTKPAALSLVGSVILAQRGNTALHQISNIVLKSPCHKLNQRSTVVAIVSQLIVKNLPLFCLFKQNAQLISIKNTLFLHK